MIKVPLTIKEQIIAQALRELPDEACGYLAGIDDSALEIIPMTNADHSPEHFSFIPEEQFRAVKAARTKGLRLLAVYHSHPASPARLSEEDLRLANDPAIIYLIVSLATPDPVFKAFRVESRNVMEIPIQFTGGIPT
jgi:proteasome lid subunit RPN8/RPN11